MMDFWLGSWRDLRFAVRGVRRDPVPAVVAWLTLALTLGVSMSAFALLRSGLWNPLPYPKAQRLIDVRVQQTGDSGEPPRIGLLAMESFEVWKASGSSSLENLSAYRVGGVVFTAGSQRAGDPEKLPAASVSGDLFAALDVRPQVGRWLGPEDTRPEAVPVVVLSFSLWHKAFGEDASILGRVVSVDGEPRTIVGVMPREFFFPQRDVALWLPLVPTTVPPSDRLDQLETEYVSVLGQLRPDFRLAQVRGEGQRILDLSSSTSPDSRLIAATLPSVMAAPARPGLLAIACATFLLLLIGSANLVALSLARQERRAVERWLRAALGASRGGLARQVLAETSVLLAAGALGGLLVAAALHRGLPQWLPTGLRHLSTNPFDGSVLAFGLATSVLIGLVIALPAALCQRRLKVSGTSCRLVERSWQWRQLLVPGEVALGVIVLIGAGLVVRSYAGLTQVDLGYEPERVLTTSLQLPAQAAPAPVRAAAFDTILERLAAHPEVEAGGAVSFLPLARGFALMSLDVVGRPGGAMATPQWSSPSYPAAVGLELLEGRWFTEAEHSADSSVVVVNEEFARQYLEGTASGRTLVIGSRPLQVVGSVRNVPLLGLTTPSRPAFFASYHLAPRLTDRFPDRLSLAIRTTSDPQRLIPALRSGVREVAPEAPLEDLSSLEASLAEALAVPRSYAWLLSLFALTSLVLALGGAYGLLTWWVVRHRRDLGIRKALGAGRGEILRLVLVKGLRLVAAGIVTGSLIAAGLAAGVRHLLYGVSPLEPAVFTTAVGLFLGCGILACALPAWRASRVDPAVELRVQA